jgi:hypothetical protein
VQELDGAGNILANLLTGLGIDEYFTRSGTPGTRTLLGDALNSTLSLADDAGTPGRPGVGGESARTATSRGEFLCRIGVLPFD